ncbi:MAG TPA: hypothetical protein ENN79_13085, partial [Desulfobacteraceae bacterium]|nr:hypothetical protein [Desulfobacteraceae bacterium]
MNFTKDLWKVNPDLAPEIMERVDHVIDHYKTKQVNLIPVLEECQEIAGYLPVELQRYIGRGLNIPGSTI